jgi:outer membrane protein OmpA-like peptidoglycan-associated protein
MHLKVNLRRIMLLGLLTALTLAAGCVIQDPQALKDLHMANRALVSAKDKGAADRFPEDFAALELRYQEARGTFYACNEAKASDMANAITKDANALAVKQLAVPAPPQPGNNPPTAHLDAPTEGLVNHPVAFHADDSSDPDGDKLTYRWDFGDGKMATFRFPGAAHRYKNIGSYTVKLTVDDGRGGTDSTSAVVSIGRRETIQGYVLFAHDKSIIKAEGRAILDKIADYLKEYPDYRVLLVGHTDAVGSERYNMALSKRRANAVGQYFISHGIAADRITTEWKGESEPVATNKTKEGRAMNRRTEITIKPAK